MFQFHFLAAAVSAVREEREVRKASMNILPDSARTKERRVWCVIFLFAAGQFDGKQIN